MVFTLVCKTLTFRSNFASTILPYPLVTKVYIYWCMYWHALIQQSVPFATKEHYTLKVCNQKSAEHSNNHVPSSNSRIIGLRAARRHPLVIPQQYTVASPDWDTTHVTLVWSPKSLEQICSFWHSVWVHISPSGVFLGGGKGRLMLSP